MKYAFRWRERAARQLRSIPQPAALTILRALAPPGDDPRRPDANVKKLAGYGPPTDRSASSACVNCGWANPSTFITAFTRVIGTTLGRYRTSRQNAVHWS